MEIHTRVHAGSVRHMAVWISSKELLSSLMVQRRISCACIKLFDLYIFKGLEKRRHAGGLLKVRLITPNEAIPKPIWGLILLSYYRVESFNQWSSSKILAFPVVRGNRRLRSPSAWIDPISRRGRGSKSGGLSYSRTKITTI